MLMIGYFEGLGSERGTDWRVADSLALRQFLGYALTETTPDHSSLSRIRQRLPLERCLDECMPEITRSSYSFRSSANASEIWAVTTF